MKFSPRNILGFKTTTAITAVLLTSMFSCNQKVSEQQEDKDPDFENHPKTWVKKTTDNISDKLDFKFDNETGLVLDNGGNTIKSNKIFDELLKKCNEKRIQTVFLGDCSHTETIKNEVIINSIPDIKKHGYSLGIEDWESNLKVMTGKTYKELTLEEIIEHKSEIISKANPGHNERNAYGQAESDFNLYKEAKANNLNLIFCEKSGVEKTVETNVNNFALSLPDTLQKKFILEVAQYSRDTAIHINKKSVMYRGLFHMFSKDDFNEMPGFGKSVTIWNLQESNDFTRAVCVFILEKYELSQIKKALGNPDGIKNDKLKGYIDLIKPAYSNKLDIPDYLLIGDKNGKNPQLYKSEEYLKAYKLNKADIFFLKKTLLTYGGRSLNDKDYDNSYYDFLSKMGLIGPITQSKGK